MVKNRSRWLGEGTKAQGPRVKSQFPRFMKFSGDNEGTMEVSWPLHPTSCFTSQVAFVSLELNGLLNGIEEGASIKIGKY